MGDLYLDLVGPLALLLAPPGDDLVGVGLPRRGGRGVGVGRKFRVGHQGRQFPVAYGAENLVPGNRIPVLRRGAPAQGHPALFSKSGSEAAGGQVLGVGVRPRFGGRLRCRFGRGFGGRCRRRLGCGRGRRWDVGPGVARPLADPGEADRLHPVYVAAFGRDRAVGVAGGGPGVAVDHLEHAPIGVVPVTAQDRVVGNGLVR